MNWLSKIYSRIWFATEFAVTPVNRRPFTFILRDLIFSHPQWGGALIGLWFAGLVILSLSHGWIALTLGAVSAFVLGHVVWGERAIFGQQESPPYLGE